MPDKQIHLNVFMSLVGHHEAAWRHPRTDLGSVRDIDYLIEVARTAERGKLDSIFFADSPALGERLSQHASGSFEPTVVLAALAMATEHIGLIATASTTFNEPYNLARRFASIDHLSRGRAGWNIVTTWNGAAPANFGLEALPGHADRYARAREFMEVSLRLWDSWEDGAVLNDREHRVYLDPSKVHSIDFEGPTFKVRGPLTVPRSPQAYPVLVQAGSSEDGKDFAATYAEAIFTAQMELEAAREFANDVKARAAAKGRDPELVIILPGFSPIIGSTEAEARRLEQELLDLTEVEHGLDHLSRRFDGFDFTGYDLDGPLPGELLAQKTEIQGAQSRAGLIVDTAKRDGLTIRQILGRLAGARGHNVFTGSPEQVADEMERWFRAGAADGFNIMPPHMPGGLEDFVDQVVPELQRRGLFRREYEGSTLRDNYGLPRPENRLVAAQRVAV